MEFINAIGDPAQKCNFDLILVEPDGEKPLWEASRVDTADGTLHVTQVVTEKGGCLDLACKVVKLRIYSNSPAVLFDMEYKLGGLLDASVSLDSHSPDPVEVTLIYSADFRQIVRTKTE